MKYFIYIILAMAIANPLCCCDMVWAALPPADGLAAESGGCCGGGASEAPEKQDEKSQHHDRDQCPHQQGNGYKQASSGDLSHTELDIHMLVLPLHAVVEGCHEYAVACEPATLALNEDHVRGPPRIYQKYCVYLL